MARVAKTLKGVPALGFFLAVACTGQNPADTSIDDFDLFGAVVAPVPISEATVKEGQLFPAYLATTPRGCDYTAVKNPPILDSISSDWYSSHLGAAGERPLPELSSDAPKQLNVRFVWLRSFDKPIIVRVFENVEGLAMVEAKRLSGGGGYEPGEVEEYLVRELTAGERRKFVETLKSSALTTQAAAHCDEGADGAQWILEVVERGRYSFFDRWTPEEGPVREIALEMLALTGWNLDPLY